MRLLFGLAAVTALVLPACVPAREVSLDSHDDRYRACARRGIARAETSKVSFAATVLRIRDETPVDGPVRLVLIRGDGQPVKATFGSLFTRPPPTAKRRETYQVIAQSRKGDCVQVDGTIMADGEIWVETFDNLDRR